MTKLIKAEFYRVTHSGIFFVVFVVFGLLPLAMPFISLADMNEVNMFYILLAYAQGGGFLISGYVGIVLSAMISNMFQNRTYYYEIMNGANTHHIILSKIIVYNCITAAVLIIPAIITFAIMGNIYPLGDLKQLWLTIILGIIIILNFACFTIFIRHILGGPVLIYTISMLPTMAYMTISELTDGYKWLTDALSYMPQIQIMEFVKPEYETNFIIKVIGSFFVSFIGLYALTYVSYKKKNFR
ncbi:MAG: hypothetical protein IKV85_02370 [Ruminococcus sp.]|nr:hypothetical protein [Ruminococcus sp.]